MISYIGNRPALQIGHYQVTDYDVAWLDEALRRAAQAADHDNFPFVEEICAGLLQYLETKCPLKLMRLDDLYERLRKMLVKIGCQPIAEKLETVAPPVTLSLVRHALEATSNLGFELAFFDLLRTELTALREVGAEEVRFVGLRRSVLILRGTECWDKRCETLLQEIRSFIAAWDHEQHDTPHPLRVVIERTA